MYRSFSVEHRDTCLVVGLKSEDGTNRLTRLCVRELMEAVGHVMGGRCPTGLVICGNEKFFSAGADLREICELDGSTALEFSKMGQALMAAIAGFPAPVYAAVAGYCMGGGMDLALSCHYRIASPHALFGHRGAALGLITGWGGTQRLPRLVGKGRALEMLVAAEKIRAERALEIGLIDAIADDPVVESLRRLQRPASEA